MSKSTLDIKAKTTALIFFCIMLFQNLSADSPCGTFVMKVTYYTNSNIQDHGYIYLNRFRDGIMYFNYVDEYYSIIHRVKSNKIDFSKIKGFDTTNCNKILAVNRSVLSDTSVLRDYDGYIDIKRMPITDSIYEYSTTDTVDCTYYSINTESEDGYALDSLIDSETKTMHYGKVRYLNLDTIRLIVLDSILWCGDNDQLQFLNTVQMFGLNEKKPITQFRLFDSETQQWWLEFFSFDPEWTKNKILKSLDLEKINESLSNADEKFLKNFPGKLQKAIKSNRVLCLLRWYP